MPLTRADLFARLDALGIRTQTYEHAPVFTVAESDALHATLAGAHTKNLFLKDKKGRMALVTIEAHAPVDLKALAPLIGLGRVSFGSPDRLRTHLGIEPGSVTPFAIANDEAGEIAVFLDARLRDAPAINVHPLENTATTAISPDDLVRFIENTGHSPVWIDLPEPG